MIIFLACVLFVLDIDLTHIPFILLFVCSQKDLISDKGTLVVLCICVYVSELLLGSLLLADNFLQFVDGAHLVCTSFPAGTRQHACRSQDCFGAPAIYLICLSALERYHAIYTRCIGRIHSLATTSGPARKVGVVSIFKMADLEQTLLNLSSSKIRQNNLVKRSLR